MVVLVEAVELPCSMYSIVQLKALAVGSAFSLYFLYKAASLIGTTLMAFFFCVVVNLSVAATANMLYCCCCCSPTYETTSLGILYTTTSMAVVALGLKKPTRPGCMA